MIVGRLGLAWGSVCDFGRRAGVKQPQPTSLSLLVSFAAVKQNSNVRTVYYRADNRDLSPHIHSGWGLVRLQQQARTVLDA